MVILISLKRKQEKALHFGKIILGQEQCNIGLLKYTPNLKAGHNKFTYIYRGQHSFISHFFCQEQNYFQLFDMIFSILTKKALFTKHLPHKRKELPIDISSINKHKKKNGINSTSSPASIFRTYCFWSAEHGLLLKIT